MRLFSLALVLSVLAGATLAQTLPSDQRASALGGLRPLASADAAQPWTGVGRLDTGISFCSATLISERLVLTAAHCLHNTDTGARIPDVALTFQAGLRNGRPEALRGVRRSFVPTAYRFDASPDLDGIAQDMALLELELPVRSNGIAPLATGRSVSRGGEVSVVSYGAEREAHASIEEGCFVLESHGAVRMLSCNVVQGSSGAPVMRVTEEGPEIVAVISAMATDRTGRDVSMAVALEGPFAELLDQMDRGARPGALSGTATSTGVLSSRGEDGGRSRLGARFIRP
jgi:protease YdgD